LQDELTKTIIVLSFWYDLDKEIRIMVNQISGNYLASKNDVAGLSSATS